MYSKYETRREQEDKWIDIQQRLNRLISRTEIGYTELALLEKKREYSNAVGQIANRQNLAYAMVK